MRVQYFFVALVTFIIIMSGATNNLSIQTHRAFSFARARSSNWIQEITTRPNGTALEFVDVDSQGRLYVADQENGKLWKSLDRGATWTEIGDPTWTWMYGIYVDSRDYVYAQPSYSKIYRSTNYGSNWTLVLNSTNWLWHWDEDSTGRLYAHDYDNAAPTTAIVYRSNTDGSSWEIWLNLTGQVWHFHTVDVAPNDYVFVASGDTHRGTDYASIRRWNGTAWEIIVQSNRLNEANEQRYAQPTTIWFMDNYAYFGCDEWKNIIRMPITGDWSQKESVLDVLSIGAARQIFHSEVVDGIALLEDDTGGNLLATWDGERYVRLFKASDGIEDISHRKSFPFFFTSQTDGKLYRIDYLTKEDLVHIFYNLANEKKGVRQNQENYLLEQRIANGTNYLGLTTVALSNVQASIKGLTKRHNLLLNTGFETGDASNWTIGGSGAGGASVSTDDKYEGKYSLKLNLSSSSCYIQQEFTAYPNEFFFISFAINSNESKSNFLYTYVMNASDGGTIIYSESWASTTIWNVRTLVVAFECSNSWTARIRWLFSGVKLVSWFDAVIVRAPEAGYIRKSSTDDSVAFSQTNNTYSLNGTTNTLNPTLVVGGQTVSHNGSLTNGTESSITNLTGILTGAVEVDANIQGSGQAILKIAGTRVLYEDSIILKGRTSNVYYGRYYEAFSPTTTTSDLIVVTDLASNITSLSYADSKLSLAIDSPSGTTSTTKVYCAGEGKPTSVSGALSWSYDNTTKILTIVVAHLGSETVEVRWLTGDINRDGKVDVSDLVCFNEAYGSDPSCPNWNCNCDCNGDCVVDASDLADLCKNYGKTV